MTSKLIIMAWIGAAAWPALFALAAVFAPWLRRMTTARVLAALLTLGWACGVWAFLIEPEMLVVKEIHAESPTWRGAPLRIGMIADVHIGAHMSPARVARIAARMNDEAPDLVVLLGDYVSDHTPPDARPPRENAMIDDGLAALGGLSAPLGVYAVLGNHDWWYDGPRVEAALAADGAAVLENDGRLIELGPGEAIWIAGLADEASERAEPDWAAALAGAPADAGVIVIAHRPDVFFTAPDRPVITLAGHSHCGQVHIPFLARPAISPGSGVWPCGLYEENGRLLAVTGGVGVSMVPARFLAPPEIVMLTLERGDDGD